jgi:hypothetical protein
MIWEIQVTIRGKNNGQDLWVEAEDTSALNGPGALEEIVLKAAKRAIAMAEAGKT